VSIDAVIAANRFGLGAKPGELKRIAGDPRAWLSDQLRGRRPPPSPISSLPTSARIFDTFLDARAQRRTAQRRIGGESTGAGKNLETVRRTLAPLYLDQVAARYRAAIESEESFRERLVHFWTNHFAVSADKPAVAALAATLENESIRPGIGGRFVDLLQAVESHPAMILYLDNQASVGPHSRLAQRAAGRRGRNDRKLDINENLAREILELHTLGVDGGYTQTDVTSFALALTGWSVGEARGGVSGAPGAFTFRDIAHEPGAKSILRKRYAEDGAAQARAILKDLARHPATATHLSTKLVRHFVADDPPAALVERIARVFRDSEGDLPSVHGALIGASQMWQPETVKYKTPHEYVVSALRMLDYIPEQPQIMSSFVLLGQRPYSPASPAGWPDRADQWDGPDALLKRIEWANVVGERVGRRFEPLDRAADALGEALSNHTRTVISRAASAGQGLTLLLASPEFQRR
jgi:uncharacterized protein (DUF1800 family)